MKTGWGKFSTPRFVYAYFLLVVLGTYAIWLLPFTVFDGFATLSNDAPSYVLLARKWSPYFPPSIVESLAWPVHSYPPGFPWLLAITGASDSLYFSHLVVSFALLAGIGLSSWLAVLSVGRAFAGALTIIFATLPGAVVHTMGILSENVYLLLSLAVLVAFVTIKNTRQNTVLLWTALFLCLSLALLTRTVGIALVAALSLVAILDRSLPSRQRVALVSIALAAFAAWQLWSVFDPQNQESSHWSLLVSTFGADSLSVTDRIAQYVGSLRVNAVTLIVSWNHYFTLSLPNEYFFWFSVALLTICIATAVLRMLRLELDAMYVLLYVGILLNWPYPAEMERFLHPVVMLLLIQPLFYALSSGSAAKSVWKTASVTTLLLTVFVYSLVVQAHLQGLRQEAQVKNPGIVHSLDVYTLANQIAGVRQSLVFQDVMQLMTDSKDIVPEGAVVASSLHVTHALLSQRPSVMLSGIISYEQQLCNFKLRDVEYVFLAPVINTYNMLGMNLYDSYESLSAQIWTVRNDDGQPRAHLLKLDAIRVNSELKKSTFRCEMARDRPIE